MVVDERSRHELHAKLEELLGSERAATLMEHLPPVGWANVATKQDLAQLREYIDIRFQASEDKLTAKFRAELIAQTRTMMLTMSGLMVTLAGLVFTVARLV